MPAERALVVWGGYADHQPMEAVERFIPYLSGAGFDVIVKDTLDAYADIPFMSSVSVIRLFEVNRDVSSPGDYG